MIRDVAVSLVVLAGTIALYASLSLMEDPRAATFPRVVILIMGFLGVALLVQSLLMKGKKERGGLQQASVSAAHEADASSKRRFPFRTLSVCFVLIVAYFFLMEYLGFYLSAFLFFVAVTLMLDPKGFTFRTAVFKVIVAFLFTGILFVLFKIILEVQTPKGLLC